MRKGMNLTKLWGSGDGLADGLAAPVKETSLHPCLQHGSLAQGGFAHAFSMGCLLCLLLILKVAEGMVELICKIDKKSRLEVEALLSE
jgi:hypothetical protein